MDDANTLGSFWCAVCTLGGFGSGTCVDGVLHSGTLEYILGVDGNCVGWTDGSEGVVSLLSDMVALTMTDSCRRAYIWSSSSKRNGDAGAG